MHVGLYFDLRNPRRWRQDPVRLHAFILEMCEEADRLGAHSVWFTEHHLFDDDYLTQPLTFAAAVAARTRRVRIGTALVIAPLHRPAALAEQGALVDLLSGGRLELGVGAGYRPPEYELYEVPPTRRYARTDETVRQVRRLWGSGGVTPTPAQRRVPIWLGYQGPQGAHRAGVLGEGLLSLDPALVAPYRAGLAAAGHDPATARMAGGVQGWVAEDPDDEWPRISPYVGEQFDSYRRHLVQGTGRPAPAPVDLERLRGREPRGPLDHFWLETPEGMAERLRRRVAGTPTETAFFWASIAGMPEDMVARNVRTICTRLAPLLR